MDHGGGPPRRWGEVAAALHALVDLALPSMCAGCGAAGPALCPDCASHVTGEPIRAVPDPEPGGLPPVWAAASYQGTVRRLVVAHKEDGVRALRRPLAAMLASSAATAVRVTCRDAGPVLLVPAPSRPAAVRERGGDPTLALARAAGGLLRAAGWDVDVVRALRVGRRVRDQAGLGAGERAENVSGAFRASRSGSRVLAGRPVVVLDDVVTTGATLAEVARALSGADADVRAAAVVAATRRTSPDRGLSPRPAGG